MIKFVKQNLLKVKQKYNPMWDIVIADAKEKLARTEAAADGLKMAVSKLEKLRDSGQPWPGESASR